MVKKIAICGKQNTGKNTLAQLLITTLNIDERHAKIIAVADPIKEIILKMFPSADKKYLWGSSKLRNNIIPNTIDKNGNSLTYRQALIDIGTLGRTYNPNIWIDVFASRSNLVIDIAKLIICPDVRFINEFDFLKKNNFLIVKIVRDIVLKSSDATETEQDGIPNEQFDFIVKNNRSIEDLELQAQTVVSMLK